MAKHIIRDYVVAILVGIIIMFLFISFLKAAIFNSVTNLWTPVGRTLDESRRKSLLVSTLYVTPKRFELPTGHVEILESWIEAETKTEYILAWFPYYRKTGACHLCLRIRLEDEALLDDKIELVHESREKTYFAQIVSGDQQELFSWQTYASPSDCPKHIKVESKSLESKTLILSVRE